MAESIAVIGAGTMGAGIAQLAATQGCRVHLVDVNAEVLARGLAGIRRQLDRSVEKERLTAEQRDATLARIHTATAIEEVPPVELAIEAVIEDLAIKRKVFTALEARVAEDAVLATNTSSLPVSAMGEALKHPGRLVGMHFFNPAPIMPLVEIIAGRQSAPPALDLAFETAKAWGKSPVRVKDTPGFIVNRVARGFYLEALRLLGEGVAGVDEIDGIMKRHGGFRMGPFELMDLVGLDVNLAVSTSVWEQMNRLARFAPHAIQQRLVQEGHLGRKTGRGFFAYADDRPPLPAWQVERASFQLSPMLSDAMQSFSLRAGAAQATGTEQLVLTRILAAIINEAGFALSEEVASAADIDLAMIKGTNYPRGPLAWADEIGPRTVRGALKALNTSVDDGRYEAAPFFQGAN